MYLNGKCKVFFAALFVLSVGTAWAVSPVAVDDLLITSVDTSLTCYVLVNDTDVDGDTLSLQSFDSVSTQGGAIADNGDGSLNYSPPASFSGLDTFSYTVTDGSSSSVGIASINVNAFFDFNSARNLILDGVSLLGNPSSPGWMVVFGETACSIGNYDGNDHREPLICGGTMGDGRILAMPDHQWLNMDSYGDVDSTGALYTNSLTWLSGTADKSIKIVVSPSSSAVTWLTAQGYTNVVQSSNYAVELADADVLVGWLGSSLSESNIDIITDFILDGGGLFVCDYGIGYSWWWGKSVPEIPSNRIMRGAGIAFTGDWPGGSLTVDKATGHTSSQDVLSMLDDASPFSETELAIGGVVLDRMYQVLPEGDNLLALLDVKFYEGINSINPTPAMPISNSFEKAMIGREASILQNTLFEDVVAHRTAEAVYGAIPVGAAAVSKVVSIDTSKTRWHSTGLYAVPGQMVTVTVPTEAVGQGFKVRLSGHVDNISSHSSWNRIPYGISRSTSVDSMTVQIASAFGGAVYFDVGSSLPGIADFDIQIDGAIEAPYFVLGETTNEQWIAGIRDNPAPFAELVCDHLAISFPSQYVRTVNDMEAVVQYWDQVVSIQDYVGALESFRTNGERINIDVSISVGWLHAGYPTQGPTASSTNLANLEVQLANGDWGWFHELGHESQRRPDKAWGWDNYYTFPGDVEVTVNIFASASLEGATNNVSTGGWGYSGYPGEVMSRAVTTINDLSSPNFDQKNAYPYYFQLADGFDWSMYRAVFQTYHDDFANNPSALPSGGQEEKDQWLIRWSQVSGYNMVNYMVDHWGLEVTSSAISQVNSMSLPDWLPVVTTLKDIEILPGGSHVFDIDGSALSLYGNATVISVELPSYGSFVDNGDGTWTYVADEGVEVTDSFSFTLESSVGNRKRYTINIDIIAGGLLMDVFTGISGAYVYDLTDNANYPDNPTSIEHLASFEGPTNWGDNFGRKVHGFLVPKETGNYTFWIASDDRSELWLSSDTDTANISKIAEVAGIMATWTDPRQWDKYSSQQSVSIKLFAGKPYYIMALHKEGAGGDNLAVAWQGPGIVQQVISGDYLKPYPDDFDWSPKFSNDPVIVSDAVEGVLYGYSIADIAQAFDGGAVTYTKLTGPGWLNVASDGTLSGVARDGDAIGVNYFTIEARDINDNTADAELQVFVHNTSTGEMGLGDFAWFSTNWLSSGCVDVPKCNGSDLNDDGSVDIEDMKIFADIWLN